MVSSNYKGTSIGFVLSPAPKGSEEYGASPEGEMVTVPAASLNAAAEYIRVLERKVADLMNAGARR